MPRLQIVLETLPDVPLVAGLPPAVRTAHLFGEEQSPCRGIFLAEEEGFLRRWGSRLPRIPWVLARKDGLPALKDLLEPDLPVLVLAARALPDEESLKGLLGRVRDARSPVRLMQGQEVLAAWHPQAGILRERLAALGPRKDVLFPLDGEAVEAGASWAFIQGPEHARCAEESLFASLPQPTDGYIARFDRRFSMALSRIFLRLPVTPNQITAASLVIGLLGAAALTAASYSVQVLGAVLLWSCCILDGCDGEVARLKLLCSPAGARFDVISDNIVHAAVFIALPLHLRRMHPSAQVLLPGALLLSGFLLSALLVWRLVLIRPKRERTDMEILVERIASRDFFYLILLLTVLHRLDWFIWAAGVGANVFWALLLAAHLRGRRAMGSPAEA